MQTLRPNSTRLETAILQLETNRYTNTNKNYSIELNLQGHQIRRLTKSTMFPEFADKVTELWLSANQIYDIDKFAFIEMTKLKKLALDHNFLGNATNFE
jgi:hypothetical protein